MVSYSAPAGSELDGRVAPLVAGRLTVQATRRGRPSAAGHDLNPRLPARLARQSIFHFQSPSSLAAAKT